VVNQYFMEKMEWDDEPVGAIAEMCTYQLGARLPWGNGIHASWSCDERFTMFP
jgi:hypothetical protein